MTTLTLPAFAFLMAISGIPGAKALPWFRGIAHHKPRLTAADSLPPQWKTASRLALEHDFVRAGLPGTDWDSRLRFKVSPSYDPRKFKTSVEPDSGYLRGTVEVGDLTLGRPYRVGLQDFGSRTMQRSFADAWRERSRNNLNNLAGRSSGQTQRTGLSLPIPVQLPPVVTSILGPGGPALNVSGSESIRLSGTSNWSSQQVGVLGQSRSLFPSLDMQQDLNIQLEGQLSDRVKVNLLQNSANQIPLSNRIAINYKGEEDDLVQALDLGNTSLALPGTQYVSYSGQNEGLFGVKLATRVGPLDWTVLASKQEGRSERASYSGGASVQSQMLADMEYDKGRYFLLYDPQFGLVDISDTDLQLFRDDANYSNDQNTVPGKAYVDPLGVMGVPVPSGTDTAAVRGRFDLLRAPDDYEILQNYYLFGDGSGKTVKLKIIRMKQPLTGEMALAAIYRGTIFPTGGTIDIGSVTGERLGPAAGADSSRLVMKLLRAPRSLLRAPAGTTDLNTALYDTTAAFDLTRELEMKNFYQLSGYQIDPKSFKLSIQRTTASPAQNYARLADATQVNYLEMAGLDVWDESQTTATLGHDGKVDGQGYGSGIAPVIDYNNGVVWFPDPRPFAPRLSGPSTHAFDVSVAGSLPRRLHFVGSPITASGDQGAASDSAANPLIYDKYNPDRTQDPRYYILAEFAGQRGGGEITLGRGNLLQGSDVVTVNGERWTRDRDYTVDYDLGRISLKRNLGPTDQLNIDYSYAPLFAQAGKTLLGSAFQLEGRERGLGGAFLYESRGAQDLRPRIGEEPSRTLITDLNTHYQLRPNFLTRLADHLPGVRTSTPSEINIQAEGGMSFPNPNTKNEVYIEDAEGVRDAISLTFGVDRWKLSSVPTLADSTTPGRQALFTRSLLADSLHSHNAEVHWYVPTNAVKEGDLKPTLQDKNQLQSPHTSLALSVPRFPKSYAAGDSLWFGLTYTLDQQGLDLSRSQFIEVWVNDFNDHHDPSHPQPLVRGAHARLHIDLGVVSEDMMRAPNRLPNSLLDTEDQVRGGLRDHELTVSGNIDEDTGYDGLKDKEEPGYQASSFTWADLSTARDVDPEGDDYREPDQKYHDIDARKWAGGDGSVDGTEGNKKIFPYTDTEDLNLNDHLDTKEDYFEYTIDLGDSASSYMLTDVQNDPRFRGLPNVTVDNGWRLYRIPIADGQRVQFGQPDLTIARHVRVWVDGLKDHDVQTGTEYRPTLMLGGLDIVGNRWQQAVLTPRQRGTIGTTMTLNSINSQDNSDKYVTPFDPGKALSGNQASTRREQSLSLEFTNLAAGDTLEAYRTFSVDEDYTRYGALSWYAAGFEVQGYDATRDSLEYFVRFSSDERGDGYYEVKRKLPRNSVALDIGWEKVNAALNEISNFKLLTDYPKVDPILYRVAYGDAGDSIIIRGRPSFTRLRRISIGLINEHAGGDSVGRMYPAGQLWFDELRATDVKKDVGIANRVSVGGHIANLASFNVAWNSRDADFLSVGETRGSGSRTTNLAVTSSVDTHRFFEGTGIQLPVSMVYSKGVTKPRFTAGDDVVRTGAQQEASQSNSTSRSISTTYSRVWSERSNPLLRYTIGGVTASGSRTVADAIGPTGKSSNTSTTKAVNWTVAPRSLLALPVGLKKLKFYPLPERVSASYLSTESHNSTYVRDVSDPTAFQLSSDAGGRIAGLDLSADSRPFDFISHHVDAHRALTLSNVPLQHLGFLNFGRTTSWRQTLGTRYTLQALPFVRPSFNYGSGYSTSADLQSANLSVHSIGNNRNIQMTMDLPFDQLTRGMAAARLAAPAKPDSGAAPAAPKRTPLPWRQLLARLGSIQTDYSLNRTSSFSRLVGNPNPAYLIGLSTNPGLDDPSRLYAAAGNTSADGVDWRANARTRIQVLYGSGVNARASFGDRTQTMNGVATRTADTRFPDLDFDFGKLADVLKIGKFLNQPQLRTGWTHQTSTDYRGSSTNKQGSSTSNEFRPLLSVRGALKNGTQADLSVNYRGTRRESFQYGTSSATTDNNSDVNFTLSRSYSQGQKVQFMGKTRTVRSSVSMQLTTVYSHHTGQTTLSSSTEASRLIDESRLSVTGTGNYGFSSTVTGSAVLGFSQNKDNAKSITNRSVRVELRSQFSF